MSEVEILELFSRYGLDAALMAMAAAAVTFALDRLLLKKLNLSGRAERAVKFLPYVLGILFYAIYSLACNNGISCFFETLAYTVRQGIAVGTLGFALCLLADKIIDGRGSVNSSADAVEKLIEGYICPNECENAACLIKTAIDNGETDSVKSILEEYAVEDVTEAEIEVLKNLIFELYNIE